MMKRPGTKLDQRVLLSVSKNRMLSSKLELTKETRFLSTEPVSLFKMEILQLVISSTLAKQAALSKLVITVS